MDEQTTGECRFCLAKRLPADSDPQKESDTPYLIARLGGFLIMSDHTPLAPGHALLVPEEHVSSYSLLSGQRLRQAEQLAVRIADGFYEIANSTTLLVEDSNERASGQHAVLHLIPAEGDATRWFRQQKLRRLAEVWNLNDLHSLGGNRYVFAQQFARTGAVWDANDLPEHWLDWMINDQLGDDEWGWRDRLETQGPEIRSDAIRANLAIVFAAIGLWMGAPPAQAPVPPSQHRIRETTSTRPRS